MVCSLAVAIILVPVLASKYLKINNVAGRRKEGKLAMIDNAMARFFNAMDNGYAKLVKWVLHHKALFLICILVLLILSFMLIPKIGFVFMPGEASNNVSVQVEMPKGTKLEVTDEVLRQMETIALQEIKGIQTTTISTGSSGLFGGSGTNSGSLTVKLFPFSERLEGYDSDVTAKEKLRKYFSQFPGANFSFGNSGMLMGSNNVDIIIKSDDLALAKSTSEEIISILKNKASEYVTEPTSDMEDGLPQVDIIVDRERMYNLGLNIYSVSNEIKANINGVTASRYQDGGSEIDIVIGLDEADRSKLTDLEQIFVTNSSGQRIPLANFATYRESTSPVAINRENQTRIIHVTANANPKISISVVQEQVEKVIKENLPQDENVSISYAGSNKELMDALSEFAVIILMAVVLVFAVMASQFESFKDPFIVIFTIPLSVIGIVAIYLITGISFSVITAVGLLILVGIIVNNGIVLVDYTNLLRKRGQSLEDACVNAAKNRLRPILMTTLTTVLSLVPMAFFPGEGSEMVQPIGQTVFGGLTFGTLMTLFLMPTLYYIFNRRGEKKRLAAIEKYEKR